MKAFVVSDVHGFYNKLMKALDEQKYDPANKDHIFISCGDLLDRGPDAVKCLKFVNNIPNNQKILIKGNHEELMQDIIQRGYFAIQDFYNGTADSIRQILNLDKTTKNVYYHINEMGNNPLWNDYIHNCIDYYENADNIFVHGWIPCFDKWGYFGYNQEDWRFGDWKEARWLNGMEAWSLGLTIDNKTIYCGHWHTSWGHSNLHHDGVEFLKDYSQDEIVSKNLTENFNPFIDKGIVALDACTAYTHKVNCVVIDNFEYEEKNI